MSELNRCDGVRFSTYALVIYCLAMRPVASLISD